MAMNRCYTFPKAPGMDPHYQIQFSVISWTLVSGGGGGGSFLSVVLQLAYFKPTGRGEFVLMEMRFIFILEPYYTKLSKYLREFTNRCWRLCLKMYFPLKPANQVLRNRQLAIWSDTRRVDVIYSLVSALYWWERKMEGDGDTSPDAESGKRSPGVEREREREERERERERERKRERE